MDKCPQCGSELKYLEHLCKCSSCDFSFEKGKEVIEKNISSRYIFISYGHDKYAPLATRLKNDLKKRGHVVWTDLELKVGDDWEIKIENALENTISHKPNSCFLLLMSPYSIRRPNGYCLNELAKVVKSGILTIPIKVVDEVEPPLSIARIQFLDMSECYGANYNECEYKRQLPLLLKAIEQNSIDFDGGQSRLQNLLKPIEFKSEIKKHIKFFTGRRWLLDEIRSWLEDTSASKVFWLTGGPGVGKTALSIWLSCIALPEIHAWHLCQHSDNITSNPKNCILSLAYYLSTHLPTYSCKLKQMNIEEIINLNEINVNTLFMRLLVEPLNSIEPSDSPVVILIDAIDEASMENGENPIAKFIGMNFAKFPSWIRFILTSRPVFEVKKWLRQLNPIIIDTSDERNIEDLRLYIYERLKKYICSDSTLNMVVNSIISKSEGVFLYAEFVCDSIEAGEIDINEPDKFPSGLYNVYEDYFNRRFPLRSQYNNEVSPLLRLLVVAKEPLSFNDLLYFLNYKNSEWDEDFLETIIKQLGTLFRVHEDMIVPFHKSIIDWLTIDKDSNYYINRVKGNKDIIEWAHIYENNYAKMPIYFLKYLCDHLLYVGNVIEAIELLKDKAFLEEQIRRLDYDNAISIYFSNLRNLYKKYKLNVLDVYNSSFFLQLLERNRRYFLDNGYFLDLSQMEFQKLVDSLLELNSYENSSCVGILYYLYAIEKFDTIIVLTKKILQQQTLLLQMSPTTKSQMYEVYGLSLRKLGLFKDAICAFEATCKYGELANDSYQISLGYANLAKIYYHQVDFNLGYRFNKLAFDFLECSLNKHDELYISRTSIQLFMAEYKRLAAECYIWGGEYDKAKECFCYIEDVYNKIPLRDRYFVRYLYSSALYSICVGDTLRALEMLKEAEPLCRNGYDKAIIFYYEAIILFIYGDSFGEIKNRINMAKELFISINSKIEMTEVCMLEAMMSRREITYVSYDSSNEMWFLYVFNFFKKLFIKNDETKSSWKWRLDTDREKRNICISTSK